MVALDKDHHPLIVKEMAENGVRRGGTGVSEIGQRKEIEKAGFGLGLLCNIIKREN